MLLLENRALAPVELHPASTPPPPTNRDTPPALLPTSHVRDSSGCTPEGSQKLQIMHAMIREARLPHGRARFQPIRKSSFDELHGPLQGNLCCGRQQRVDVIGHDDEFVEKEFSWLSR